MSTVIDSIPIDGLRKAHLLQLAEYIHMRDHEGWYYGHRKQFEKRHKDLLKLADYLCEIYENSDIKIKEVVYEDKQRRRFKAMGVPRQKSS